jgi:hypothetical protein
MARCTTAYQRNLEEMKSGHGKKANGVATLINASVL